MRQADAFRVACRTGGVLYECEIVRRRFVHDAVLARRHLAHQYRPRLEDRRDVVHSLGFREVEKPLQQVVTAVRAVLEETPPELASDIIDKGMVMTGGGALLKNLDKLLKEESGLPITITEDPLSTVAVGSGKVLDSIEILKQVVIT